MQIWSYFKDFLHQNEKKLTISCLNTKKVVPLCETIITLISIRHGFYSIQV